MKSNDSPSAENDIGCTLVASGFLSATVPTPAEGSEDNGDVWPSWSNLVNAVAVQRHVQSGLRITRARLLGEEGLQGITLTSLKISTILSRSLFRKPKPNRP